MLQKGQWGQGVTLHTCRASRPDAGVQFRLPTDLWGLVWPPQASQKFPRSVLRPRSFIICKVFKTCIAKFRSTPNSLFCEWPAFDKVSVFKVVGYLYCFITLHSAVQFSLPVLFLFLKCQVFSPCMAQSGTLRFFYLKVMNCIFVAVNPPSAVMSLQTGRSLPTISTCGKIWPQCPFWQGMRKFPLKLSTGQQCPPADS